MKQPPPPIVQAPDVPGPGRDSLAWILRNLSNIKDFISHLAETRDTDYAKTHLSRILGLRRSISQLIDELSEDPYNTYPPSRLQILHKENERIFTYIEGAIGTMNPWDEETFQKLIKSAQETIKKFIRDLE